MSTRIVATSCAPARVALEVEAVGKAFGRREALRGVSFQAAPGEVLAVLGPNGAGKTTLLQILAGALAPSAGRVAATGRVGWVPQHSALYAKLTVAENLRLFARLEGVEDAAAAVGRMLEQTGLADRAHEEVGKLSGGNRQRVNVAVGLLADPPVLLLDEPGAALDPRQRERLWSFVLARAGQGTTVLFSTHDVDEAERCADRLVVLADGALAFLGAPEALRERAGGDRGLEGALLALLAEREREG